MLGRERREERREARRDERQTFGLRGSATRYQMREKIISIGDDLWITDESNRRAFKVDGKALRLRRTLVIEDASGNALVRIQDRPVRLRDTMEIEAAGGGTIATVKKALIAPLRTRFSVDVAGGPAMDIQGNILDHEYEISAEGRKVAEVSRKWFRIRDTYGVEIAPGQNEALILAITVCVDEMAR